MRSLAPTFYIVKEQGDACDGFTMIVMIYTLHCPCALDPPPPRYKRLRGKSPAVGYGYPSRPHLPGKAVTSTPGLCKRYYRAQRPLIVLSASK